METISSRSSLVTCGSKAKAQKKVADYQGIGHFGSDCGRAEGTKVLKHKSLATHPPSRLVVPQLVFLEAARPHNPGQANLNEFLKHCEIIPFSKAMEPVVIKLLGCYSKSGVVDATLVATTLTLTRSAQPVTIVTSDMIHISSLVSCAVEPLLSVERFHI